MLLLKEHDSTMVTVTCTQKNNTSACDIFVSIHVYVWLYMRALVYVLTRAADVLIMMCQALTATSCAPLPPQQASCCVLCNFVVVIVALTNYLTNLVCAHCFIWQHLFHTMRVCFRFVFYSTLEYTV